MKRYNINFYNGWPFLFDLVVIPAVLVCCAMFWLLVSFFWLIFADNIIIPTIAFAILAVLMIVKFTRHGFVNRFYYDEKNEEIILKLIHQKPRRIPIRDIALVSPKINENYDKGPVSHFGKNNASEQKIFGVSDADGRDFFYIKEDPILFELFEKLKINIKRKED